jgi:hypothetical protein
MKKSEYIFILFLGGVNIYFLTTHNSFSSKDLQAIFMVFMAWDMLQRRMKFTPQFSDIRKGSSYIKATPFEISE